jgi:hypothetical protein
VAVVALVVGMVGTILAVAGAPRQTDKPSPVQQAQSADAMLRREALTAGEIVEMTGLNLYKFGVVAPKDREFELVLRRFTKEGVMEHLHRMPFKKLAESRLTLRIGFLSELRKLGGVLLSTEPEAILRVTCVGGEPGGWVTVIKNPAEGWPVEGRTLVPLAADGFSSEPWSRTKEGGQRLLVLFPKNPLGVKKEAYGTVYPRAEVVLIEKDGK